MRTKRYTVVIAGLIPEIVTQNILVKIWGKAAKKSICEYRHICKCMVKRILFPLWR